MSLCVPTTARRPLGQQRLFMATQPGSCCCSARDCLQQPGSGPGTALRAIPPRQKGLKAMMAEVVKAPGTGEGSARRPRAGTRRLRPRASPEPSGGRWLPSSGPGPGRCGERRREMGKTPYFCPNGFRTGEVSRGRRAGSARPQTHPTAAGPSWPLMAPLGPSWLPSFPISARIALGQGR